MSVRKILTSGFLLLGLFVVCVRAARPAGEQNPPRVYIDKGACPFECCTYREWVARTDVALLDSPNGKRTVGTIKKGQKVLALTGEIHSVPLKFAAQSDYPEAGVKAGDTIFLLHYVGEGFWKVWHDGKVVEIDSIPGEASKPKAIWWVELKTPSGAIGWTVEHRNFDNQDACG